MKYLKFSPIIFFLFFSCTKEGVKEKLVEDFTETNELPKSASLEEEYGLGNILTYEHSNDVNYNWYFDQYNSGRYADVNCGPTSTTMAIKWVNENFNKTPEDARNAILPRGGWWYTNNVIDYLNNYSINNYTIKINQIDAIKDEIDNGNIAILCLDMYYIRNETNEQYHVDKFYKTNATGWGHFIVAKGYKVVDGNTFYEIYDPNSWGSKYQDGALKGIDRYYRSIDLNKAVTTWWSYAIIASKSNLKSSTLSVDVNKIEHKPGL